MLGNEPQATGPSRALADLIGSIYDCTLDPELWDRCLGQIKEALGTANAVLSLADISQDRFLLTKQVGIPPEWMDRVAEHATEINSRLTEVLAWWPSLDEPFVVRRHMSESDLRTSPYFNDVVSKQGLVDIMSFYLMVSPTRYSALAAGSTQLITDRQVELGQLLLPHLRRAVTISNVLDARAIERARMADALDALHCGVILANERADILHANRSAEQMLRQGRPLRGSGGVLGATDDAATHELRAAIKIAARDETGLGRTGLAVPLAEPEADTVFAHVLPLASGETRTRLQPDAVAAVFVGQRDERDGADLVAAAFGLTPAETRVLSGLVAGSTIAETAAALGIAPSTARTHLENIFSKTGIGRQADLIRLAARMAPPTRSRG
ncbi:MAG: helix-turn-helix transcriptional regulator [Methyloceanibacter sp.]|uniref:helix-turn-helix transcriptional regulator n=1 Tax=Methyloceanibacter sp. TaxID=1965321 RepID=UPI003D6CB35F